MSRRNLLSAIEGNLQTFATYSYVFQHSVVESLGLHPTDFLCLHILDQAGSITAGQLARQLGLTSGATTAVIDRLSDAGYVKRSYNDQDRRSIIISLDTENIEKLKLYYKPIQTQVETLLKQFSDSDLETISRFFQLITQVKSQ